jgi:hypothetical protein
MSKNNFLKSYLEGLGPFHFSQKIQFIAILWRYFVGKIFGSKKSPNYNSDLEPLRGFGIIFSGPIIF